jgi:hypothetical protein
MTYTILSAQFADPLGLSAVIVTQEAGHVVISQADTPNQWQALLNWGTPEAYSPPLSAELPTKEEIIADMLALQTKIDLLSEDK